MNYKRGLQERKNERGSVLALAAVAMLALILAVGLGVDITRMYAAKTELQNACDAAALAGASALNSEPSGISEAVNRATLAMNKYNFNNANVSFPAANVLFAVNLNGTYMSAAAAQNQAKNIRFVRVTTPPEAVPVSFAGMILGNSTNLTATATAGDSVPINVICNFLPAFVLDNPANPMSPGSTYTFRLAPATMWSPGNYSLLAFTGPGGSVVKTDMAGGTNQCASPGDVIPTKTGLTAGDVRDGLNTRFDIYAGGLSPTAYPPDTNIDQSITYAEYAAGSPTQAPQDPGVAGRRIVLIPITKNPPGNGSSTIVLDRFGVFFLLTSVSGGNGGNIQAYYIGDRITVGRGGFNPGGGTPNGQLAIPVLYQ